MMQQRIEIHDRQVQSSKQLTGDIHPLLRKIYLSRGVLTDKDLELSLKSLARPEQLLQLERAVERLALAIQQQQRILIVGDFDADGATGTALAVRALKLLGAKHVNYKVPNRFEFGYGLSTALVDSINNPKPDLILTVDNGVSSIAGVARAAELGIDVVITDHHLPGKQLPAAYAMINPNQAGDKFPSKNLAGVGVVFYLMLALRANLHTNGRFQQSPPNLANLLDLVALGTVADVVPLDHNNRILVQQGLARIRAGKAAPGILALFNAGGRHHGRAVASDLGFTLGPRLNAAGRMKDMSRGIECLLTDDFTVAKQIASELDQLNKDRRKLQESMQQEALLELRESIDNILDSETPDYGLCLFNPGWHQGIVGLVASRIKDKIHKPVIAFAPDIEGSDALKGSARSIKGIHIRDILAHVDANNPGLITAFGGHAMAAGLSLPAANFGVFEKQFQSSLASLVRPEVYTNVLETDGVLKSEYLTLEVAQLLRQSGPWGQEFPEPSFHGVFTIVQQRMVAGAHLKLVLLSENETPIDAIAFYQSESSISGQQQIEVVYKLDVNEFRDKVNLQLIIEKIL